MGRHLAVDTNVFLLADEDVGCNEVYRRILYSYDYALLIDPRQEIWKEYRNYARQRPQSLLSELVKRIIDQQNGSTHNPMESGLPMMVRMGGVKLTEDEIKFLTSKLCDKPIEPQLFAVTSKQPVARLVVVGDARVSREPVKRGYRQEDRLREIASELNLDVVTTDDIQWLNLPESPAPTDEKTLRAFLESYRLDPHSIELDFIEAKCSKLSSHGVSKILLKKVMEAVCAMTNSVPGYIFVGVDDDGSILGISREYDGTPVGSWDKLWSIFTGELGAFRPTKPIIDQWWIPITSVRGKELAVCVIRVHKLRGNNFSYHREIFRRQGTASVKATNR